MSASKNRALGCWYGQLVGDALGAQVEFQTAEQIREAYPNGVRHMEDGGAWGTIAGQVTDDSELAMALLESLVARRAYDEVDVRRSYLAWLQSKPFDCGIATQRGILGDPNPEAQSNGAMMRASPLAIWGRHDINIADLCAQADAALTHPHLICQEANGLYVRSLVRGIQGQSPKEIYDTACREVRRSTQPALIEATLVAAKAPPTDFITHMGHVTLAWQNALYQLLHAPSFEEGLVDTVGRGGDTDTNAAIAGALLGSVYGFEAIPQAWERAVYGCQPREATMQPRPMKYWPRHAKVEALFT